MTSEANEPAERSDGRSWPIAIIVLTGLIGLLTGALTVIVMNSVRRTEPAPIEAAKSAAAATAPPRHVGYEQPRLEVTRAELTAGLEGREGRRVVWVDNPRAAIPFLHGEVSDGEVVTEIKVHGPAPLVWMVEVVPRGGERAETEQTTTTRMATIGDVLRTVHPGWAARNAWLGETLSARDRTIIHAEEDWVVEVGWTKHGPRMATYPTYRQTMERALEASRAK